MAVISPPSFRVRESSVGPMAVLPRSLSYLVIFGFCKEPRTRQKCDASMKKSRPIISAGKAVVYGMVVL